MGVARQISRRRYITITRDIMMVFDVRHDRDAVQHRGLTPFARDPMKGCHELSAKAFDCSFYSQLDWHHPDYWPRGRPVEPPPPRAENGTATDFMDRQLEELLTHYGPIGGIWFDRMWTSLTQLATRPSYALIHRLQPAADRAEPSQGAAAWRRRADVEQDLPGANTAGFNTKDRRAAAGRR
jgi:alpha-L-fucosidase